MWGNGTKCLSRYFFVLSLQFKDLHISPTAPMYRVMHIRLYANMLVRATVPLVWIFVVVEDQTIKTNQVYSILTWFFTKNIQSRQAEPPQGKWQWNRRKYGVAIWGATLYIIRKSGSIQPQPQNFFLSRSWGKWSILWWIYPPPPLGGGKLFMMPFWNESVWISQNGPFWHYDRIWQKIGFLCQVYGKIYKEQGKFCLTYLTTSK